MFNDYFVDKIDGYFDSRKIYNFNLNDLGLDRSDGEPRRITREELQRVVKKIGKTDGFWIDEHQLIRLQELDGLQRQWKSPDSHLDYNY